MKYINLTQGKRAMVDDKDYKWLNCWKWYFHKKEYGGYADRAINIDGKIFTIPMARQIIGILHDKKNFVDHINHNTLDNRCNNLRMCTPSQNSSNRLKRFKSSSRFKGVNWDERKQKWKATVTYKYKVYNLGYFHKEKDAAKVFNNKAKELHGEFALLNKV